MLNLFKNVIIIFYHFLHHFYRNYRYKFDCFSIFKWWILSYFFRIFSKTIISMSRFAFRTWNWSIFFRIWSASTSASFNFLFCKFLNLNKITAPRLLNDSNYFKIISQACNLFFKLPITFTIHSWFLFFSSDKIFI